MKPIPSPSSREAQDLLNKAQRLLEKTDELEKAKCDCGKEPCECKDCPKCGSKMKAGGSCMKASCGGVSKAQPGYNTTFNSEPQNIMFAAESGGQTRNAYYNTNQHEYTGTDVTNKGATSESVNFESLGQQMNPHHDSVPRQVENGTLSKAEEALAKAKDELVKAMCEQCGGNQFTGCRFGFGDDCPGLEGTTEMGEGEREDYHPSEYMRGRY
jgi:hypothetical protein